MGNDNDDEDDQGGGKRGNIILLHIALQSYVLWLVLIIRSPTNGIGEHRRCH